MSKVKIKACRFSENVRRVHVSSVLSTSNNTQMSLSSVTVYGFIQNLNSQRMLIDSLHLTVGSHSPICSTLLHCNISAVGGGTELPSNSESQYVIVIAQVPGIYGSKQTESEGVP